MNFRLLGLLFIFFVTSPSFAKFTIIETNASYFPKISLIVQLPQKRTGDEQLLVIENGRLIRGIRVTPVVDTNNQVEITFLSAAQKRGRHKVVIDLDDQTTSTTYSSGRWRRLGKKKRQSLKLRATGPGWTHIPCRFVALHESGRTFEDFVSKGGYGRLGTGLIAPPGNYHTELRLLGLDCPVDHFRLLVKPDRPTYIHRRFGFLNLPNSKQQIADTKNVHIEIERVPSRFPSIRRNLASLMDSLPDGLPKDVLPLPAGTYKIKLRRANLKKPSPIIPLGCTVEIVVGQRTPFPAGLACK